MTLACGIILYEVRHLPSASRNLVSESILTHGMGMSILKVGTNDAVIGHLPKGCPTVEVIVSWIDGLYVFTDEESKMVSPKVINSFSPPSNSLKIPPSHRLLSLTYHRCQVDSVGSHLLRLVSP